MYHGPKKELNCYQICFRFILYPVYNTSFSSLLHIKIVTHVTIGRLKFNCLYTIIKYSLIIQNTIFVVPQCRVERRRRSAAIYYRAIYHPDVQGNNVLNWHMSPSVSFSISITEIEGLIVPNAIRMHAFIVNII
jgi:hypothetical protein